MTDREKRTLDMIISKLERLQNQTRDKDAQERMQSAKNELMRIRV